MAEIHRFFGAGRSSPSEQNITMVFADVKANTHRKWTNFYILASNSAFFALYSSSSIRSCSLSFLSFDSCSTISISDVSSNILLLFSVLDKSDSPRTSASTSAGADGTVTIETPCGQTKTYQLRAVIN